MWRLALAIALGAVGCLAADTRECASGGVCPAGLECRLDRGEQICALATCGNGVVEAGESCDDGNNNSDDTCPGDCVTQPACGDGDLDFGEDCDDGNRVSGDGCQATCRFPIRPPARWGAAMAYDPRRDMLVVFGGSGVTMFDDIWEWDGREWFLRHPLPPRPPARVRASMVFLPALQKVVMFGGTDIMTSGLGDLWEWDGTAWNQLVYDVQAPSTRAGAAMTYDAARGVAVLFGGGRQNGTSDETWTLNVDQWQLKQPVQRPMAREDAAMTFDDARAITYLVGRTGDGLDDDRTWMWDGTDWTFFDQVRSPGEYRGATMAFDQRRQRSVLFGGDTPTWPDGTNHIWELDGRNWIDRSDVPGRPPLRTLHSMAYVPSQQAVVVFGGLGQPTSTGPTYLDDLWSWDGTTWRERL